MGETTPSMMTVAEAARYLRVGRRRVIDIAEACGALWYVGDRPRVVTGVLDRGLAAGLGRSPAGRARRRTMPADEPSMQKTRPGEGRRPAPFDVGPYRCRPHRWSGKRRAWSWRCRVYEGGAERAVCLPPMGRDAAFQHVVELVAAEGASAAAAATPARARSAGPYTVGDALRDLEVALHQRQGVAPNTRRTKCNHLRAFLRLRIDDRPLADMPLAVVDDAVAEAIVAARGQGRSPGTVQRGVSVLREAFRRAVRLRLAPPGWVEPEWPTVRYRPARQSQAPSPEQMATLWRLLDAEGPDCHLRVLLGLQAETGARIRELAEAPADRWRLGADPVLIIRRAKTGDREVPLTREAVRLVRAARRRWSGSTTLWPRAAGAVVQRAYRVLRRYRVAGLVDIRPHDLRAWAADRLIDAGVSLAVVADILGNSPEVLLATYASSTPGRRRAAIRAVDRGTKSAAASRRSGAEPEAPEHSPEHSGVSGRNHMDSHDLCWKPRAGSGVAPRLHPIAAQRAEMQDERAEPGPTAPVVRLTWRRRRRGPIAVVGVPVPEQPERRGGGE